MFALLLVDHPVWNNLLRPVILDGGGANAYPLLTYLDGKSKELETLGEECRKIVSIYECTSEEHILRAFVREKLNKTEFRKKFSPSFPNYEIIVSAVENANYKMAAMAVEHRIPVFKKDLNYQKVYLSDEVALPLSLLQVNPFFSLSGGQLQYSLRLRDGNRQSEIPLLKKDSDLRVLSRQPACVVIYNKLYIMESTGLKKISAFFDKKSVSVPASSLFTYMKTFVWKTLREEERVEVEGFSVVRIEEAPRPVLLLKKKWDGTFLVMLQFAYGDKMAEEDSPERRFVTLNDVDGNFRFDVRERDFEKEREFVHLLEELGLQAENRGWVLGNTTEPFALIDFLVRNREALEGVEIIQDQSEEVFVLEPVESFVSVEEEGMDWFELKGMVKVGEFEIQFSKLRNHIVSGERIYEMEDGRMVLLPEELFAQYGELLRRSEKGDRMLVRRSLMGIMTDHFASPRNLQHSLMDLEELPKGVNAELRDYQKVGYSWLVKLYQKNFGGCMADDMGLGKTLQFLTFFRRIYPYRETEITKSKSTDWCYTTNQPSLFDQVGVGNEAEKAICVQPADEVKPATLVVLPTSLLFNWVNEKNKFVPSLTHYVHAGEKRVQSPQVGKIFAHYNLIFTTYGILRKDVEYLKNYKFECVVFDESQNLKNPGSQIYKSALQLEASHFYCVTGTPIENGMMDLWAQMNLVNRDILGSANYFHKYFELPIQKGENTKQESLMRKIINPFILRRTKHEVESQLPEKYQMEVFCEMNEEHRKVYETQKSAVRNTLMDEIMRLGKPHEMTLALSSLTMLRQLSNHVSLVDEAQDIPSSKVEEVLRRLESLKDGGHKVLIFSSFVRFLEVIEKELKERSFRYSKIVGTTKDRDVQVSRFQEDDSISFFLVSLKAGGVGLNLTAADYVFLIDPWWNPAAELQAEDRAHRIGQTKSVFVYRFIMKDTIEEKVLILQNKKRAIANSFLRNNNPFDSLDKSEWEDLFK